MIKVQIVADSINSFGDRLTSLILIYPRIIHSEMMTHRMFSRNASSSRAVPVDKMIKAVRKNTFCPFEFQKSHKGMQGSEYFTGAERQKCVNLWLESAELALQQAEKMKAMGISKQIINRILEPYQYYTVLLTATEFENFFELRCPQYHYDLEDIYFKSRKDWLAYYKLNCIGNPDSDFDLDEMDWYNINKSQAEIHIQALAESMWDCMNESTPQQLKSGEWHMPYGDDIEFTLHKSKETGNLVSYRRCVKLKISTARCARLSYQTVGDNPKIDYEADIRLHDMLLKHHHMSPFEHCQKAMTKEEYESFIKGEINPGFDIPEKTQGWCDNMKGFISYRYLLENNLKL